MRRRQLTRQQTPENAANEAMINSLRILPKSPIEEQHCKHEILFRPTWRGH